MSKEKSFEALLEETKTIVEKLNRPDITLQEAVELYEKGLSEIKKAQTLIEEAKAKIDTIAQDHKGESWQKA